MSDTDRLKDPATVRPPDTAIWAAVSHEIRTPLTGVMGMLEVLGHTSLTEEQRRIIATAESSSRALMRIVDDVLDFARLESTSVTLAPAPTDLGELAEDCAMFIAGQAAAKGIAVTCETDHRLPTVMCDPVRVRQLLINLGGNAVKFSDHGEVAISVRMTGATATEGAAGVAVGGPAGVPTGVKVRLSVADSGIGIPEDLRALLFQPFSRLALDGPARGGVGLGLAICRRIVEIMGGAITVDGAAAGTGTVFHVDLPLPVAAAAPESGDGLAGLNVLAVDGDRSVAIALGYLEAAGAMVTRVASLADIAQRLGPASAPPLEAALVVLGPDAESEDIVAVRTALRAMTHVAPSILWLRPRVAAAGQVVDSINAYPLRRAELLAAAQRADPASATAPIVTRRAEPQGAFPAVREEAAATARAENRVVLVAEDNPVNQDVLRQQLSILGFDCDIAEDGAAALKALEAGAYLAMLCDCHMPGMDGFELTKRVRAREAAGARPRLPIIAVTANALPGEAARCRAAGMDDYLSKPIEIRSLNDMLGRWIPAAVREIPALVKRPEEAAADIRNLEAIYGNNPGRLARVLTEWRTGIEDSVAIIAKAFSSGRFGTAIEAAHRIKGSAGIAGAFGLSADAAALEVALREGRTDDARDAARRVERAAAAALGAVARDTRDKAVNG